VTFKSPRFANENKNFSKLKQNQNIFKKPTARRVVSTPIPSKAKANSQQAAKKALAQRGLFLVQNLQTRSKSRAFVPKPKDLKLK